MLWIVFATPHKMILPRNNSANGCHKRKSLTGKLSISQWYFHRHKNSWSNTVLKLKLLSEYKMQQKPFRIVEDIVRVVPFYGSISTEKGSYSWEKFRCNSNYLTSISKANISSISLAIFFLFKSKLSDWLHANNDIIVGKTFIPR